MLRSSREDRDERVEGRPPRSAETRKPRTVRKFVDDLRDFHIITNRVKVRVKGLGGGRPGAAGSGRRETLAQWIRETSEQSQTGSPTVQYVCECAELAGCCAYNHVRLFSSRVLSPFSERSVPPARSRPSPDPRRRPPRRTHFPGPSLLGPGRGRRFAPRNARAPPSDRPEIVNERKTWRLCQSLIFFRQSMGEKKTVRVHILGCVLPRN